MQGRESHCKSDRSRAEGGFTDRTKRNKIQESCANHGPAGRHSERRTTLDRNLRPGPSGHILRPERHCPTGSKRPRTTTWCSGEFSSTTTADSKSRAVLFVPQGPNRMEPKV